MTLKRVRSGERLRIPADAYNAFIEASQAFHDKGIDLGREVSRGRRPGGNVVPVRNDSGADQDRFAVLGIDVPIFGPGDNLQEFQNRPAFKGIAPAAADHLGRFVILLGPAKKGTAGPPPTAGAIVPGLVAGVTPVRVDVQAEGDGFADVADGMTGHLKSGPSGAAQILWKEAGIGVKWAVVRVGLPFVETGFWAKLSYASSSPAFVELERDATTVKEGGRTGNALEVNGVEDIPADTVVWVWPVPGSDPAEWRFAHEKGGVFPITLSYDGGSAGSETTQASWTYTVTDALSEVELGTTVDPTAGVHKWVRPTVGVMLAATFGYAHRNAAGDFVIGWINEVADQEACA